MLQTEILETIPVLINAIRMIHSISHYYNTSERMTALFVKVTNQMITSCKRYIYEKDSRIWELVKSDVIERFGHVRRLNQQYQACFHKEKAKLQENPDGKQFDFSERSIFGKFDSFCRRTEKVCRVGYDDMLHFIVAYASTTGRRDAGDH